MLYVVLLVVLVVVVYIIVKIIQSSSPKGFAKGIAKAQLQALAAFKSKYPDKAIVELYKPALMTRPGYTEDRVESVINGAKEACEESGLAVNFQAVVVSLVAHEFIHRTGNSPLPLMNDFNEATCSVIASYL